jgi:uncharacterized membrane protein YtjA (UPF0391 family)
LKRPTIKHVTSSGRNKEVKLGTSPPILQGIADKGFSAHQPCPQIFAFLQLLTEKEISTLYWALVFFIIAIIAGVLGFTGIAAAAADIARVLFFIFLVFLVAALIMHVRRRGPRV